MERLLTGGLAELGITPPPGGVEQLARYAQLLLEQNKVMNLTAITVPEQVAALHFLDSAALMTGFPLAGKRLIDVGTGAGFPGLVLKLLEPTLSLTLLDSLGKRLDWLGTVCAELGVASEFLHQRAEEQALKPGYRDSFDFATARAVADLRLLCELCLPFVKIGGKFLAMKTADCDAELAGAINCIRQLGGRALPTFSYHIPGTDVDRRIIVIEKIAQTPKGYPRRWAKIQKSPL